MFRVLKVIYTFELKTKVTKKFHTGLQNIRNLIYVINFAKVIFRNDLFIFKYKRKL